MMSEFKISSLPSDEVTSCFPLIWRLANALMAIFLAFSTFVQVVYGVPCILCASICAHPPVIKTFLWKALSGSHLSACVVGGIYLSTSVARHVKAGSINPFTHEEGRLTKLGAFNCMYIWSAVGFIAILPFALWGIYVKTMDKESLPGHCKNLILQ